MNLRYQHEFPGPELCDPKREAFAIAISGGADRDEALRAAAIETVGDSEVHARVLLNRPEVAARVSVLRAFRDRRTADWHSSIGDYSNVTS